MTDRASYLAAVAAGLPVVAEGRDAVLDELDGHLEDTVASLVAAGMAPDTAEAEAERRLGPPDRLAAELVEAHRAPRAMLAAAGGGIVAMAGRTVLALFGAGVIVWLLLVAALLLLNHLPLATPPPLGHSAPPTDLADFAPEVVLAAAAATASHAFVATFARRAWRDERTVGRTVGLVGVIALFVVVTFVWAVPMSWGRIAGLMLIPPAWFLGAWPPTARRLADVLGIPVRLVRAHALATLMTAGVVLTFGMGLASTPNLSGGEMDWTVDPQALGWDRVAPAAPSAVTNLFEAAGGFWSASGVAAGGIRLGRPLPPGWHDLRLEAWREVPIQPGLPAWMRVDPKEASAFAMATIQEGSACPVVTGVQATGLDRSHGLQLCATVRVGRTPGVTDFLLFVTGQGPDGHRYRLADPFDAGPTQFNGTIWEWFTLPRG